MINAPIKPRSIQIHDLASRALRPIGKSFDVADPAVAGLLVRVGPAGTKRWLFRYQWNGERTRIALGVFPEIGIAAARELALAHLSEIKRGIDPRASSRPAKAPDSRTARQVRSAPAREDSFGNAPTLRASSVDDREGPLSISQPDPGDKTSFHLFAYEYVEYYVKPNRELPREVVRILKKDILPYWGTRDARTITSREIVNAMFVRMSDMFDNLVFKPVLRVCPAVFCNVGTRSITSIARLNLSSG